VLSGRGLCDELITRLVESYRLWYVVVCDLDKQTSWMRRRRPTERAIAPREKKIYCVITSPVPCVSNWRWNTFSPWLLLISLPKKFIWTILCVAVSLLQVCVCVCVCVCVRACVAQQRNVMSYRMGGAPKTSAFVRPPNENYCVREYNFPNLFISMRGEINTLL
jgi:hypothetical protein